MSNYFDHLLALITYARRAVLLTVVDMRVSGVSEAKGETIIHSFIYSFWKHAYASRRILAYDS